MQSIFARNDDGDKNEFPPLNHSFPQESDEQSNYCLYKYILIELIVINNTEFFFFKLSAYLAMHCVPLM